MLAGGHHGGIDDVRLVAVEFVGSGASSITKALVRAVATLLRRQAEQTSAAGAGALSQLVRCDNADDDRLGACNA